MATNSNKFPFTATQFQELQHQALIYKYMVSNIPVPSDLLFTIKRSCSLDPTKMFGRQPPSHIGWSCFQMGLGRKIDPEPGRCRRTDGKKWRCSKEAYPDSKYCERHMHRGKNRSRKPVEIGTNLITTTAAATTVVSSITKNNNNNVVFQSNFLIPPSHSLLSTDQTHHNFQNQLQYNSSSRSHGIGLSSQDSSTHLLLDSSLSNTDYRNNNTYGFKEVDEHAFFSEPSGSMRSLSGSSMEDAWQFTPLTMNSSSSSLQNDQYPYLQLRSFNDHDAPKQQKQLFQDNYSYFHGSEQREEPQQQTVHRFFDDLPPKNRDSWLDLDDKSQNSTSVSTTRLSISIPSPSHDFPIFSSSTHNDG